MSGSGGATRRPPKKSPRNRHQQQESSAEPALLVLEKGVLASKPGEMPLELPSINAKLRCATHTGPS